MSFYEARVAKIAVCLSWLYRDDRHTLWLGDRRFYWEDRFGDVYLAGSEMPITIERQPLEVIFEQSVPHWAVGARAPDHVRHRWAVNHIRHSLTPYDGLLAAIEQDIGIRDAADRIRERILAKIAAVYPEFDDEATRQIEETRARTGRRAESREDERYWYDFIPTYWDP
jgi:hypothetical protein